MPRTVEKATELALPLEPAPKPKDEPKPNAEELAKLVGVYRHRVTSFELKLSDGKLTITDGKKEGTIEALGGMRFRREGGEEFEVVTGKDGKTTYLIGGGRAAKKTK